MTQAEMILDYMQTTGPITPLIAVKEFGCMRLGARIYDLKQLGVDIRREIVNYTNDQGEKKRFAEYWIHREQP